MAVSERRRALLLADFNGANFASYLAHDAALPQLGVDVVPLAGDVGRVADQAGERTGPWDLAIVWTRPEAVSASFARLVETGEPARAAILSEVDEFADHLVRLADRAARVLAVTWQPPRLSRAFRGLAMKEGTGLANEVMRMNLRLAERVEAAPGVTLLDSTGWLAGDPTGVDARLWYAAKVPFRNEVFRRAARDVKAVLRALDGGSRKLIVVDLDGTLWGGIVGEVGWEGLRLGGHDPIGEAYADFQRALKALARRGILLAIASKNDEDVAAAAIERHPEMVLRSADFVARRINWGDKADNIVSLAGELNLGLSSMVFIDDSPTERGRVREALPEVLVPEWPATPMQYVDALLDLGCFETVALTDEDRQRSAMYAAEAERALERREAGSAAEWLRRLELRVQVEALSARNLPRAVQLLNKTNQMNLSTRRLGAAELEAWLRAGPRWMWTFRVRDRFGDSGLTGLASLELRWGTAVLVDFVLSCRVFGRSVEDAMLHVVTRFAAGLGARRLIAEFLPTGRNGPCLRFLEASRLRREGERCFAWDLPAPYPLPDGVDLLAEAGEVAG